MDEAWDSPHNKPLLEKMPDVYKRDAFDFPLDTSLHPGYTTFLAPIGEDTVFGGVKATRFRDIWDGTSNTVALVEVQPERAVPWTAPDDYVFDPAAPATGLRRWPDGKFLVVCAYGSVRELSVDLDRAFAAGIVHKIQNGCHQLGQDQVTACRPPPLANHLVNRVHLVYPQKGVDGMNGIDGMTALDC